jgi:hypothetical protein
MDVSPSSRASCSIASPSPRRRSNDSTGSSLDLSPRISRRISSERFLSFQRPASFMDAVSSFMRDASAGASKILLELGDARLELGKEFGELIDVLHGRLLGG